jgi:hypothetical protein
LGQLEDGDGGLGLEIFKKEEVEYEETFLSNFPNMSVYYR